MYSEAEFIYIQKLIMCGYTPDSAGEMVRHYTDKGAWNSLKAFVNLNQILFDDRKQYPKEDLNDGMGTE